MFLKEMTQYLRRWNPVDVKEIEHRKLAGGIQCLDKSIIIVY